ncbi:MAG: hypothetical protein ACLQU2_21130 [Candidatus Binataceae bacterium]
MALEIVIRASPLRERGTWALRMLARSSPATCSTSQFWLSGTTFFQPPGIECCSGQSPMRAE